jgi:two-component system, LuxR family, sensor kinase FixL
VTLPSGDSVAPFEYRLLTPTNGASYWAVGALYTAAYVLIERITFVYQLDGLGITLWSPSAGLSVTFLLLFGARFAPFVFAASVITNYAIYTGPRGIFAPIGTGLVLMLGFAGIAAALTTTFRVPKPPMTRVLGMLGVVPGAIFFMASIYCAVLYASDLLSIERFLVAMRNSWIGDTLGVITLLPAVLTALDARARQYAPPRSYISDGLVFAALLVLALWIIFGVRRSNEYQFFYLLFIPVVWIAVRAGYTGVSLALPVVHLLIVSIATASSYAIYDFIAFQMLMLVLSASGLLLGAAVSEARTSAERVRAQEVELARAARHALVGATGTALAHEISQPLASATNYLHAARRLLSSDAQHCEAVGALAMAESEAQRARETLERVRDYVSSGRLELSDVDVGGAARKIAAVIWTDARRRGVGIEVVCKPHLPMVLGDAIQLEQLFLNLITNAVDAASGVSGGGHVTVGALQCGDRLRVAVEDNGRGVPPRVADRLFEPFETTKRDGMGLGLTLARQIVEAHGGQLHWENLAAGGARFTVDLRIDGPPRS